MSFVLDQIRRIDAQLDRHQQLVASSSVTPSNTTTSDRNVPSPHLIALQTAIRGLSTSNGAPTGSGSSDRRALLRLTQIQSLLSTLPSSATQQPTSEDTQTPANHPYETELEWLVIAKATTQVYGHALTRILESAVAVSNDVWYWDSVLGSRPATLWYSAQTAPPRLWHWSNGVWEDVQARQDGDFSVRGLVSMQDGVTARWKEFYRLVNGVVKEQSVHALHTQIMLTPVMKIRSEIRHKQHALKKIRTRNANALGVLLGEGLANESVSSSEELTSGNQQNVNDKWKASVARNVALIEAVLAKINDLDTPLDKFDAAVAELTDDDPLYSTHSLRSELSPPDVAERLSRILTLGLPQYADSTKTLVGQYGRPSRLTRYWLPVTVGLLSSSTVLRMLFNRQAEVIQWVQDLGATVVDFWKNWVVEPTRKLIKTIRHDEGSDISIMSKRSLEGDRESLERMVVDFAIENPVYATGSNTKLTDAEITDIRAKIREGDLTPVLKAYEKDLASPFKGTIRGNLIRALLIQVQKTKVDVEVAMGGIDALLKSQELCIGIISLTPGILITYFVTGYLRSWLSDKRGSKEARKQGTMLRQLRNIDRILISSTPTDDGELFYKDQGLLLCEIHVLRQTAEKSMPAEIYKEFCDEADELCDVRIGRNRQKAVANRIRWAYARWLS